MRRWNGWGDDSIVYEAPVEARQMLEGLVGPPTAPRDQTLSEAVARVPASRLPEHALVSDDPELRLRCCCGQSLGDWIALRAGDELAYPDGVARPSTDSEVRELLAWAGRVGARVVPYGGGTSVVGHLSRPPGEAPVLTLSLERIAELRELDATSGLATFGAGVKGPELEALLEPRGFTLGHYPQSFELSTLGGWIVTRSCGQQSLHYGRIDELFAGGKVETPRGTLEMPPFPGSAAGPDLRQVVAGSEGRVGVLTEATVRVSALPEDEEFHALFFPDWGRALEAARQIAQARIALSMLRVSTAVETATTLALAGHRLLVTAMEGLLALRGARDEKCMVLLGVTGRRAINRTALKEAVAIAGDLGAVPVGQTMGRAWKKNRFRAPYLRNTLWEAGYAVDTLETATTWAGVQPLVDSIETALKAGLEAEGERTHVFTHLSHLYPTGANIYTTYLFRVAAEPGATRLRWKTLKAAASRAIVEGGGTISHQHGVGTDHKPYLEAEKGELGLETVRALVGCLDPEGTMNPGKLVD